MTPPVLIDVNHDNIEDIIIPLYNSTLYAFDGRTFQQLWNRTFPSSETYRFYSTLFFFLYLTSIENINHIVLLQSDILIMMIYLI